MLGWESSPTGQGTEDSVGHTSEPKMGSSQENPW